jgi:hypothetical protein
MAGAITSKLSGANKIKNNFEVMAPATEIQRFIPGGSDAV